VFAINGVSLYENEIYLYSLLSLYSKQSDKVVLLLQI